MDARAVFIIIMFEAIMADIGTAVNEGQQAQFQQSRGGKIGYFKDIFNEYCIGPNILNRKIRIVAQDDGF